jgi:predicted nucleic acid-binding protein
MKGVFDTNILIDYLTGIKKAKIELAKFSERAVSVVTWMEVLVGAKDKEQEKVLLSFLNSFELLPLTIEVAAQAVELRRLHRIKLPDAIVWASAKCTSSLLITRNTKDFPGDEPGIRCPYRL